MRVNNQLATLTAVSYVGCIVLVRILVPDAQTLPCTCLSRRLYFLYNKVRVKKFPGFCFSSL